MSRFIRKQRRASTTSSGGLAAPLLLEAAIEEWPLKEPFRITGHTWESIEVLVISLEKDGRSGRGEAAGVYYRQDRPAAMIRQIEALRPTLESGITRAAVQKLLPPGGARNALDCALWDLEAKLSGQPAWQLAGLARPKPLLTTFTCGAAEPQRMAATACRYQDARAIKLKLTGEPIDAERVLAVREALPDVWLGIDANQGFTPAFLEKLMPVLVEAGVQLIEQPFPIGEETALAEFRSAIPIAADESAQGLSDLPALVGHFDTVNIKLDKCGGLSEGLAMAHKARQLGLSVMVGNMPGTSLAMAPAFLLGQLCDIVDLDGPVFLRTDRAPAAQYECGFITCPPSLWG